MMKKPIKNQIRLWAVLFWLLVWQIGGMLIERMYPGGRILIATPVRTAVRFVELASGAKFWKTCAYSMLRIGLGFIVGSALGIIFAALSAKLKAVRQLMAPFVAIIKSVPVVSFIILALIWLNAKSLSAFISALMVFPTVYLNVLSGIDAVDKKLIEMADVFNMSPLRRLRGIWLPQVLPYLKSAFAIAAGLSWKSGAAAEVIGLPAGSIGERLYTSKVYFETADLFAWTAVLVALSAVTERLILFLLDLAVRKAGHKCR